MLRCLYVAVILLLVGGLELQGAPPKVRFTDVSASSGLRIAANTGVGGTNPHAVAVEDFNGDGLPDVVMLTFGAPHAYVFRNLGKFQFQDVTKGSGLESFAGEGTGAAVADFDRDGKLDLYTTSLRNGASRLYRGNGDGTFRDVSDKAGVLLTGAARSCAWNDVNGDGWPDLYVTCPNGPNLLFRNNRNGTFTNVAREGGVEQADRHSLGCAFGDVDADGRDDLFVTNYESQSSTLFRSLGEGKFQDVTATAGLGRKASAVGCAFGDMFRRGRLDLYVSTDSWLSGANYTESQLLKMKHTVEPNVLYSNEGSFRFAPRTEPTFALKTLSHDIALEDFDHDGWPEIYVGVDAESGNQWATSKGGNPLLTRPDGKGWVEASQSWGVRHEANCVCVPAADFDGDGDLDLLLVNFYTQPVLYRNETNDKRWLQVRAVGDTSSSEGIGAKVAVFSMSGRKKQLVGYREIQSGAGYCRSSPLSAHFGLGDDAGPFRVEVTFPVSRKTVVREGVKGGENVILQEK